VIGQLQVQDSVQQLAGYQYAHTGSSPSQKTLVQCAKDAVHSGMTLFNESVAGGSIASGPWAADSNARTAAWLSRLDDLTIGLRTLEVSDSDSQVRSTSTEEGAEFIAGTESSVGNDPLGVDPKDQPKEQEDYDSDEELAVDLMTAALKAGHLSFDKNDWIGADAYLQEALTMVGKLPLRHRQLCDPFDLRYRLAVSAFHTQKPTIAESALISLVQQEATTDNQRLRICDAGHLLAVHYLRKDKFERAKATCESTLKGRKRLLLENNTSLT
jgi:hypothetical protein